MRGKWFHKIVAARGGLTSTVWTAPVRCHGRKSRSSIHARAISGSHIQRPTQNIGLPSPLSSPPSSMPPLSASFSAVRVANTLRIAPRLLYDSQIPFIIVRLTPQNHLQRVFARYTIPLQLSSINALWKSVPNQTATRPKIGSRVYDCVYLVLFVSPGKLCIPCLKQSSGVKWKHGVSSVVSTTL